MPDHQRNFRLNSLYNNIRLQKYNFISFNHIACRKNSKRQYVVILNPVRMMISIKDKQKKGAFSSTLPFL